MLKIKNVKEQNTKPKRKAFCWQTGHVSYHQITHVALQLPVFRPTKIAMIEPVMCYCIYTASSAFSALHLSDSLFYPSAVSIVKTKRLFTADWQHIEGIHLKTE